MSEKRVIKQKRNNDVQLPCQLWQLRAKKHLVGDAESLWSRWESFAVSGREVGSRARDVAPACQAAPGGVC